MLESETTKDLKQYFEGQYQESSVDADWDGDLRAWVFRFDKGSRNQRTLRISSEVIDDTPVSRLIAKLERSRWKEVLERAGSRGVLFTSEGFQIMDS